MGDAGLARGVSRREPARTYAAIETERAPGSRARITRGPSGSAVRSNIGPMVRPADAPECYATSTAAGRCSRPGRAAG